MTYVILKTVNGNTDEIHSGLPTHGHAHDILESMEKIYKEQRKRVRLGKWAMTINEGEIVYQIGK